jgi:hypothetical protein
MDRSQPTASQVHAIAIALCALTRLSFPETRTEASKLIKRLGRKANEPSDLSRTVEA